MAFGFPYPRSRATRSFPLPQEELLAAVKWALEDLGWPYKILGGTEFQARIPTTNWSWHHELKVKVCPGGVIQAESKSAYQEMFFDLGRNKNNLELFFARLEQGIRYEFYKAPPVPGNQEPAAPTTLALPKNTAAKSCLGGCLAVLILLIPVLYFISAVIGLITGNLYLPSRGGGGGVIHGLWARIISAIILAIFAWALIWLWRKRNLRP